jgi:hypothetical protein
MWFQKNKWKILVPVILAAILAVVFYFGGDAPGAKGWTVEENAYAPVVSTTPEVDSTLSPMQDKTPDAMPSPEVDDLPEAADAAESISTETPASVQEKTKEPAQEQDSEPAPEQQQPAMKIDPETGKDQYLTTPVPEGKPIPVEPQDVIIGSTAYTCTISISCGTINDNMDLCDPAKADLVPADGWILQPMIVTFYEGESVFNVLQRVCKQQKIHMEFENTPIYNSAYIEGIHNLYEFDVGELSGWMYKVNEWFPNYGCSRYALHDGDVICWVYTCDLGRDVGGGYAVGNK